MIHRKIGVRPQIQRLHISDNIQLCNVLTLEENGVHKDEIISVRPSTDDATQEGSKENYQPKDEVERLHPEKNDETRAEGQSKQKEVPEIEEQKLRKEKACNIGKPWPSRSVKRRLQIFVRSPLLHGLKTFCFHLDPETSISSLKDLINSKINVQPKHQCLHIRRTFCNFQLDDLLTLDDCGIQQDETIFLRLSTVGLLGGGRKDPNDVTKQKTGNKANVPAGSQEKSERREQQSPGYEAQDSSAKMMETSEGKSPTQQNVKLSVREEDSLQKTSPERAGLGVGTIGSLNRPQSGLGVGTIGSLNMPQSQEEQMEETMTPQLASAALDDWKGKTFAGDHAHDNDQPRHLTGKQEKGQISSSNRKENATTLGRPQMQPDDQCKIRAQSPQLYQASNPDTHRIHALVSHEEKEAGRQVRSEATERGDTTKPNHHLTEHSRQEEPVYADRQDQHPVGPRNLIPAVQARQQQTANSDLSSQALAPWKDTPPLSEVQKGMAWQKVSVDLAVSGSNNPTFLGPVHNPTIHFTQNVTLPRPSSESPRLSIATDVVRNELKDDINTLLLLKSLTNVTKKHGKAYMLDVFYAFIDSLDGQVEQVKSGSITFVVRILSRVGLEKLWTMYVTGELAMKLTEIFITDELTTEDKTDLSIQVTIPESDYEQACRFFDELESTMDEVRGRDVSRKTEIHEKQFGKDISLTTFRSPHSAGNAVDRFEEATKASHATSGHEDDVTIKGEMPQKQFLLTSSETRAYGGDPAEHAADRCGEALRALYTTTGSYAQMIKWVDDKTKQVIVPKLLFGESDKRIQNYEDIFHMKTSERGPAEVVVLTGKDDKERSFLLENIAYDWAAGSSSILQKFKLVVLLQMGAFQEESDFVDTIYDQLLWQHRDINKDDLLSFIDAKSHEMLLLLDNFDKLPFHELVETKFGSVRQILRRMVASGSTVLITTYPNKIQALVDKSLLQEPYIHVALPGVFGDRIEEFVSQICSEETGQAETLLKRIKSSKHLSDLAKDMKLLLLLCLVSKHSTLPETLTRVFDEVVRYIFTRRLNMSQEEISGVVNAIGKTALGDHHETPLDETRLGKTRLGKTPLGDLGFVYDWQWYVSQRREFTEKEFKRGALDKALQAGFLSRQPIPRGEVSEQYGIRFIHKRMQDFCGAKYCQSLFDNDTKKFQEILDRHSKNREFLLFLCGDNEQCARHVLGFLHTEKAQRRPLMRAEGKLTVDTGSQSRTDFELALNCYFESQSTDLFSVDFIDSLITEEMTIDYKNNDSLHSVMWILEHISKHDRGRDFLARVRSLTVSECNPARSSKAFGSSLAEMKGLCSLQLNTCILTDCDVSQILSSVGKAGNLTELVVSNSLGLDDNAETWASSLNTIIHLKSLTLSSCNINAQDFTHVARWLVEPLDLTYLNLSNNGELGGTANVWALHLKFLKSLKKLDLSSCEIEKQDMKYITASVGVLQHLYDLDLSGNKALGGCAGAWATSLKNMVHLETLRMANCNTDRRDVTHLVKTISLMANLMEFDFGSGEAELRVCSSDEGTRLTIGKFSFFVTDVVEILQSLSNREDLVAVTLHDIYGVSGSAAFWASNLKKLTHLGELNLSACILLSTDIGHLAAAVSQMPALKELKLEGNLHLGGSGREWAPSLTEMVHILSLRLGSCDLQSADIPHIAAALSRLPNLQNVDLRGNKLLRGSAETWAPSLKEMEHVRLIELGGCSLTDEDLEHVSKVKRSGVNLETD
ncbi:uncharacterized protein LOC110990090 [Acanthaster planci]|uniref:Uncharacterized protein LOC110990090 n=1 Tax=Acanthaster planci TaxID=133434 RepID=A0A8B7ZYI6_ACAPL|nr:uncharacterized protein LOC110990090 [Acanthaster planci]